MIHFLETVYARHNVQDPAIVVVGKWDTIKEFDKREWSDPVVINRDRTPIPIATIELCVGISGDGSHSAYHMKNIYHPADMVGLKVTSYGLAFM